MEIAVADMADDRRAQAAIGDFALGFYHTFRQALYRHAHVCGDGGGARSQRACRPVGIMARLPKPAAVLRPGRPIEWAAVEIAGDLTEALRLLGHARFAAV